MIGALFRGKRKDNGAWEKGFHVMYSTSIAYPYSYTNGKHYIQTVPHNIKYEVEPETVCQCINVADKNGNMIFRGDIVKRWVYGKYIIGEVVWFDIGFCGFYLKCGNSFYPIGKDEEIGLSGCDEITGNIFDNPELLSLEGKEGN